MCLFGGSKGGGGGGGFSLANLGGAPVKTSYDIQREAENERVRLAASTAGFGANILTAGFGRTTNRTAAPTMGITLGAA